MKTLTKFLYVLSAFYVFCCLFRLTLQETIDSEDIGTVENDVFKEQSSSTEVFDVDSFIDIQIDQLTGGETHVFETDINQLLGIIINSLYTNKDIFLREMISNASDAIDKIRFQSLINKNVLDTNPDLQIYIRAYPDQNKLVIRDDGHGMTKEDLIRELGTIARSGTKYFIEQFTKGQNSDLNLIGQFGVGFYSSFLVAERVMVISKHNDDDQQHIWISTADGKFDVYEDPRGDTLGRGTEIHLFLKEGMEKYLETDLLTSLVTRYSEFVPYPINLWTTFEKEVDIDDYDDFIDELSEKKGVNKDTPSSDDDADVDEWEEDDDDWEEDWSDDEEEEEEEKEEKKNKDKDDDDGDDDDGFGKTKKVQFHEWKVVNQNQPLWTRNPQEIYKEEYMNFYKSNCRSNGMWNPLAWTHFKVEGNIEFSSILYIPKKHPDRFMPANVTDGITLYVKRVMITKDVRGFLPRYLNFITGVVDSNDLPLHISRELLQKSKLINVIKKKLERKVFDLIRKLAREERARRIEEKKDRVHAMMDRPMEEPDEERYPFTKFWEDWGFNIRQGVIEDHGARKDLIPLLRYYSTKSEDELTSFEDYVSRMPENQPRIYYCAGENFEEVRTSPFLEELKFRDFEVLYFTDPIDEAMIKYVRDFAGIKVQSVTDADLELGDEKERKKEWRELKKEFKPLTQFVSELLGTDVQEVRVGKRMRNSMAVVVAPKYGMTAQQIRNAKGAATAKGIDELNRMMMKQRVFELNPYHENIKMLLERVKRNPRDKLAKRMALLMFDTALVRSGYDISKSEQMADHISFLMEIALREENELDRDLFTQIDIDDDDDDDLIDLDDLVDTGDDVDDSITGKMKKQKKEKNIDDDDDIFGDVDFDLGDDDDTIPEDFDDIIEDFDEL